MGDKQTYPMMTEKCWWIIREQFKKTIPATVSVSYLKSLLSLTSDKSASNLLSPLKQMKLIDEKNKPTDRANEWRSDSQYSNLCQKIVKEIYPTELTDLFPDPVVDIKKAKEWFMNTAKIGESAAAKISATFILLRTGQISNSSEITTKPVSKGSHNSKKTASKKSVSGASRQTSNNRLNMQDPFILGEAKDTTKHLALHIDLQIHISPEATPIQIDNIFESIAKHLYDK